jgi:hypothetical protein
MARPLTTTSYEATTSVKAMATAKNDACFLMLCAKYTAETRIANGRTARPLKHGQAGLGHLRLMLA